MSHRSSLTMLIPWLVALSPAAFVGCRVVGPSYDVKMKLHSNAEGTTYRIRDKKFDQHKDENWVEVEGSGRDVVVAVSNVRSIELEASAPGYETRRYPMNQAEKSFNISLLRVKPSTVGNPRPLRPGDRPRPVAQGERPGEMQQTEMEAFNGSKRALIIGISEYGNLDRLENARRDAKAIAAKLEEKGMSSSRIQLLLDEDATRENIIDQLTDLVARSSRNELIILYYAGHGKATSGDAEDRYLLPFDADESRLDSTAIPQDLMVKLLSDEETAQRQYLVLDCCNAGGKSQTRGSVENMWGGLGNRPGRVIMTSTKGNEFAADGSGQNSPFAQVFLDILDDSSVADTDEDGKLTADEIFNVLKPRIRTMAKKEYAVEMTPQLYGKEWAKDIVLFGD